MRLCFSAHPRALRVQASARLARVGEQANSALELVFFIGMHDCSACLSLCWHGGRKGVLKLSGGVRQEPVPNCLYKTTVCDKIRPAQDVVCN